MRELTGLNRVVIKIGTNLLVPGGRPDEKRLSRFAGEIAALRKQDIRPLIISSGAIGFGARALGLDTRPKSVEMRQACAAVGQPILMNLWQSALSRQGLTAAQILLRRENFDHRASYLNLRSAVESLLKLGAVPVLNENDSVSTAEIGGVFGDNDSLSAHVASKLDAGLLILLTDIDAFYDKDPREHSDARPLTHVDHLTPQLWAAAGSSGSLHSTGGMLTKLQATEVASRAGCPTVLADGREPEILQRIISGEEVGTFFQAGKKLHARSRWILSARPAGRIFIDQGAARALSQRKSLLPSGITGVEGVFSSGDVIEICPGFKGVTSMDSGEIRQIMGRHSREIKKILGPDKPEEVVHAENLVALPGT